MNRLLSSALTRLRSTLQWLSSSQGAFSAQYSRARLSFLSSLRLNLIGQFYNRSQTPTRGNFRAAQDKGNSMTQGGKYTIEPEGIRDN
jgi:hypothetical protein